MNSIQTQKFEKEEIIPNLLNERGIILYQNKTKIFQEKKTTDQYSPLKIDGKILSNILANPIQYYIIKKIHDDHAGFIPETQGWFIFHI